MHAYLKKNLLYISIEIAPSSTKIIACACVIYNCRCYKYFMLHEYSGNVPMGTSLSNYSVVTG